VIISIDTLKQDSQYRTYVENAWWDVIVIDEAHNVARRGGGSQRARVAGLLARRSDTLILLSATSKLQSTRIVQRKRRPTSNVDSMTVLRARRGGTVFEIGRMQRVIRPRAVAGAVVADLVGGGSEGPLAAAQSASAAVAFV
jgi:hypothetical protein